MALYMGATMAIVRLAFMLGMYSNRKANVAILVGATIAFVMSLYLVRSQDTVADIAWMKAVIPRHSIAILTSERVDISDARVRELADATIEAQRGEIAEMKRYIADIQANGDAPAGTARSRSWNRASDIESADHDRPLRGGCRRNRAYGSPICHPLRGSLCFLAASGTQARRRC
ncbi:protein of unknown function [Jannaschia faecimaris]|uniref:Uncharacterized protein n=1 Tax=Jannaschia faecimaris TaxID=1244108 RepID=A0A1H3R382_9RHOB|nr:DUF305 domain-containing protein [Jannaschia faecimaris]SDZ19765.1 protein of unknown function [Jannaschia faecimaris]